MDRLTIRAFCTADDTNIHHYYDVCVARIPIIYQLAHTVVTLVILPKLREDEPHLIPLPIFTCEPLYSIFFKRIVSICPCENYTISLHMHF